LRPLDDEELEMSPENRRFRLAKGDLQHPSREFVLNERFEPLGCVEIRICSALP
jgi:hypothetical protein